MGKPNPESLKALKMWLDGKSEGTTGRTVATFQGLSAERLDHPNDLVALHPTFERDWLNKLMEVPFLRLFCLVSPLSFNTYPRLYTPGFSCRRFDYNLLKKKDESSCVISECSYCRHSANCLSCGVVYCPESEFPPRTYMCFHCSFYYQHQPPHQR